MLELNHVSKTYRERSLQVTALDDIQLQIGKGEFVCIAGPSGSGKTTLLLTLGGMLRPSRGTVQLDGKDLYTVSEKERNRLRSRNVGFIFQMFHLLPYVSVLDNVLYGNRLATTAEKKTAMEYLERVHLAERMQHLPGELSVGECRRVALARALYKKPMILLADEPTGNLDAENAQDIMTLLADYHGQGGTIVMVTHGTLPKSGGERILYLRNGKIAAS
jgi:putative ABC transport system ATP-binding protein